MIRAVLFDVDGTLYLQPRLRALMAGELAVTPWFSYAPWRVVRLWSALRAFRDVREELRTAGRPPASLEQLQYSEAAARAGVPVADMQAAVEEWIVRRPLKYLPHVVRPGTREAIARLRESGRRIGVFSDYPALDKLKAMRLDHLVSLSIDATEAGINAFKPHPRGFLVAAERWGLPPADVLYVGDRPEIDATGAAAAGMRCAVIGRGAEQGVDRGRYAIVSGMMDLAAMVDSDGGRLR